MRHELAMIQHCIAEIKDKGLETDAQYWVNEAWMRLDEEDRKIKKKDNAVEVFVSLLGALGFLCSAAYSTNALPTTISCVFGVMFLVIAIAYTRQEVNTLNRKGNEI